MYEIKIWETEGESSQTQNRTSVEGELFSNRGGGKKKLCCTFALITLLKDFEAAHERIGFKIVAIRLITLLKDQGHNNSNYLQFSIPPIILL